MGPDQRRAPSMKQKFFSHSLRLLAGASLTVILGSAVAQAQQGETVRTEPGKPPYNIIFVISDQRAQRLFAGAD